MQMAVVIPHASALDSSRSTPNLSFLFRLLFTEELCISVCAHHAHTCDARILSKVVVVVCPHCYGGLLVRPSVIADTQWSRHSRRQLFPLACGALVFRRSRTFYYSLTSIILFLFLFFIGPWQTCHWIYCFLFQATQSSNLTPVPPKQSSALPIVRSTLPLLSLFTRSRSSRFLPPPAYVTGIEHHSDSLETSSSSMPCCSPSLSAAWMRNSQQYGSNCLIDSVGCLCQQVLSPALMRPGYSLTLVDFHVGYRLPFVHGHEPLALSSPATAQVNDELFLVTAQDLEHRVQPRLAKLPSRE